MKKNKDLVVYFHIHITIFFTHVHTVLKLPTSLPVAKAWSLKSNSWRRIVALARDERALLSSSLLLHVKQTCLSLSLQQSFKGTGTSLLPVLD